MNVLCIYHGNCADGFGAAWAVRHALKNRADIESLEFFPGVYQQDPPDVTGKVVVMVDFSYKLPVIGEMAYKAKSILILDHHKSAAEDLCGFPVPPRVVDHLGDGLPMVGWLPTEGVHALFDMEKSGAMLAWEHFHNGEPPRLIKHIQDRDLWKFELPGTRPLQANIFSYPYDFDEWDKLIERANDPTGDAWHDLCMEGVAIERKHFKDINELIAVAKQRMRLAGHDIPVLNCPYFFSSDAGHIMAKGEKFAACYWDVADGRVFSLRSTDEGLDVSEIAKMFGGGGHRNASGFKISYTDPRIQSLFPR